MTSGIANGETTTIIGPVSPGDVIVKNASEEIRDGQNIRIKVPK
ncbi:hypothetical protein [Chryseobacterium sp. CH21]|nr:hypothetical protein [Chryseobacterium sp. CH21]